MDTSSLIAALDAEIARLTHARAAIAVLNNTVEVRRRGRPKGSTNALSKKVTSPKRTITREGRARIAAAQKMRWAATNKHTPAKLPSKPASKNITKKTATATT